MNLPDFIAKITGFADRTDKRLDEAISGLRAEVETERNKVLKLELSNTELSKRNVELEAENAKLKANAIEAKASFEGSIEAEKAKLNAEAGKKAANIVAEAGFTQPVPAENQTQTTTKAEHWKRFNSLPEAERYPYWKKHREAMAD